MPPIAEGIGESIHLLTLRIHQSRLLFKFAEDCQHSCTELRACVNASIWCDGKVHCPSGEDESFVHCSRILRLPAEVLAVACVLLIVLLCACSLYIRRYVERSLSSPVCRNKADFLIFQKNQESLPTQFSPADEIEVDEFREYEHRHGGVRREGLYQLTKRVCAICGDRPRDDGLSTLGIGSKTYRTGTTTKFRRNVKFLNDRTFSKRKTTHAIAVQFLSAISKIKLFL